MKYEKQTDDYDDEQGKGTEHPDLVLRGEEEHPLRLPFVEIELDERLQITRISRIEP